MKWKCLALCLFVSVLNAGCVSYYVSNKQMMDIRKGMTVEEVGRILGEPDYRRFEGDLEEWEYRRDKGTPFTPAPVTIIVQFIGNEVISMDTYSGGDRPALPPHPVR